MTVVNVDRLTVRRGDAALLNSVSLTAKAGDFIGVIGPNGAGKTTLLRAIAGLEKADTGSVQLNGTEVAAMAPLTRARSLAYLPQTRDVHWAMTAETVVSLGRFAYGSPHRLGGPDRAAVEAALAATDSQSFRSRVVSTLSGGELARIHLARALAAETPVLIADEPTAALDLKHALAIAEILRSKAAAGGLVFAALHDIDLARRYCTRIIVLNQGTIVADAAPQGGLADELLAGVFGVPAQVIQGWSRSAEAPR